MKSLRPDTRSAIVESIGAPGYKLHLRCDSPTSPVKFQYVPGDAKANDTMFHVVDADAIATNVAIIADLSAIVNFILPQNWGKK